MDSFSNGSHVLVIQRKSRPWDLKNYLKIKVCFASGLIFTIQNLAGAGFQLSSADQGTQHSGLKSKVFTHGGGTGGSMDGEVGTGHSGQPQVPGRRHWDPGSARTQRNKKIIPADHCVCHDDSNTSIQGLEPKHSIGEFWLWLFLLYGC